jgi:predicted  nucleic acid-binding Zn-ribbon protein
VIESLNHDIEELKESKSTLESQIGKLKDELASFRGSKRNYQAEIDVLEADIAELKARWDMLYQVAEEEPAFKAYFIVAGKKNWFPLEHLSSALGIPIVLLKRQIQRFIDAGMIELEGDKIRASAMLAEKAAELEEKAVKKAKAELKEPEERAEDEFSDIPGTEYYTGPADGEDYEQPGR